MLVSMTSEVPFIFVGGLGGSGTRSVAEVVAKLGYYPGGCLNGARDNVVFASLLKRPYWLRSDPPASDIAYRLDVFAAIMARGINLRHLVRFPRIRRYWTAEGNGLLDHPDAISWMTKEPDSHLFIDAILSNWPEARYIYVSRHPLDMAFSQNKQQLSMWGWFFGVDPQDWSTPEAAQLQFWIEAERRMRGFLEKFYGRLYYLKFDAFVENPQKITNELIDTLGIPFLQTNLETATENVRKPPSSGRWRSRDLTIFSDDQLDFCRQIDWL